MTSDERFGLDKESTVEDLDLRWLLLAVWRSRWLVIVSVLLGLAFGINKMLQFDPKYEAYMLVLPYEPGASSQSKQITSLAATIGFGGSQQQTLTLFDRTKLHISTVSFAETIEKKHGFMRQLFASQWNDQRQQWDPPKGRLFNLDQAIRSELGMKVWKPPDIEMLATHFRSEVKFKLVGAAANAGGHLGQFFRVSYFHSDASLARKVLNTVYTEADSRVRDADRHESMLKKSYLLAQLSEVMLKDQRRILVEMLKGETTTDMLINTEIPYSARIIQPTQIATQRMYAKTTSISMPVVVSLILSLVIIAIVSFARRET